MKMYLIYTRLLFSLIVKLHLICGPFEELKYICIKNTLFEKNSWHNSLSLNFKKRLLPSIQMHVRQHNTYTIVTAHSFIYLFILKKITRGNKQAKNMNHL